jgi:hypothetical protein
MLVTKRENLLYLPTFIKDAVKQQKEKDFPSNIDLPNEKCIHFTNQFKYLGSLISLELIKDAKIASYIKKPNHSLGSSTTSSTAVM